MQANNDPKWTDDAAFWNEAWADMDKRLNQEPKDRKAAVVWWRRYSWLLGLIFLVTAVATPAAMAYLSQDEKTEQQQQPIAPKVPATPAPTPAVIAANTSESSEQETLATDQLSSKATVAKRTPATALAPEEATHPIVTNLSTSTSTPIPSSPLSTDNGAIVLGEQPSSFPSTATPPPSAPETSGQTIPTSIPAAKEIPAALTALTGQSIMSIEFSDGFAPNHLEAVISQPKLTSRFYLDAGASYGLKGNKIGYYAGLQYSLPISKRFSIPAGLRFRRDFHQFIELAESGTPVRYVSSDNSTAATAPDTILFEFTSENLREIVTTGFEGSIGLAYSATPRLRIGASLSVNYLQSAIARVSPQYQEEFADGQNRLLNADADLTLVSGLSFSRDNNSPLSVVGTPIPAGTGSPSGLPQFNQLFAHAGLNLSYDLTHKLSLTLSGRRLLGQPDQSKVIGLQRGQLEIGARFRLK